MVKCNECGKFVVDGENGYVSTALWDDEDGAICYHCENRAINSAKEIRILEQLKSASKSFYQ